MEMITRTPHGEPIAAYVARPPRPGPGVLVLHSSWGLLKDYLDVCDRLAAEGFWAVAPDLFGHPPATTWAEGERFARERPSDTLAPAAAAAARWLREQPGVVPGRVALLGFSLGGATAIRAAAGGAGDAVVTFYGTPSLDTLEGITIPVLGHFAETDRYESAQDVAALFDALRRQGTAASLVTYPGTGHCFVEPTIDAYDRDPAEAAWGTTLAFLKRHLMGGGIAP